MEVKTILILLVLNIALPTLDTVTDINLVIKLFRGAHVCDYGHYDGGPEYKKCEKDPDGYCSNEENNQNVCRRLYRYIWICKYEISEDFGKCWDNPASYCSKDENNQEVCNFSSHPKMAIAMLSPFLLNYLVCFITFMRKEKQKKKYLIFTLLNIYPQFG